MKRSLVVIMAVVLLLSFFAFGEKTYNITHESITMLGLEFGCTLAEAQRKLKEEHGIDTEAIADDEYLIINPPKAVICEEGTSFPWDNYQGIGAMLATYVPDMDVAGYPVSAITLQFLYPCDDEYTMIHDEKQSRLFSAVYTFESENPEAMFEDMARKLKTVYGEDTGLRSEYVYANFSDDSVISINDTKDTRYMIWESDVNTSWLVLKSTDKGEDSYFPSTIEVMYISRYGDSWISKNVEARKREKLAAESTLYGNNDTSGL